MLPLPVGREAGPDVNASRYERHRPERTLLYQLVTRRARPFPAIPGFPWPASRSRLEDEIERCLGRPPKVCEAAVVYHYLAQTPLPRLCAQRRAPPGE